MGVGVFCVRAFGITILEKGETLDGLVRIRLIAIDGRRDLVIAFRETPHRIGGILVFRVAVDEIFVDGRGEGIRLFFKLDIGLFYLCDEGDGIEGKVFADFGEARNGLVILLLLHEPDAFDVKVPRAVDLFHLHLLVTAAHDGKAEEDAKQDSFSHRLL